MEFGFANLQGAFFYAYVKRGRIGYVRAITIVINETRHFIQQTGAPIFYG